jgi:hypothetical protein
MWTLIAEKTFTPSDFNEVIGGFSLAEGDDVLWVRITQLSGDGTNPWSYGILGWKSSDGYELGSCKAYGTTESEVFRLGVGRTPSVRDGSVTFEPRGFNLGWIRAGWPWPLRFEAQSGSSIIQTAEPQVVAFSPSYNGSAVPYSLSQAGLATLDF